VDLNTSAKLRSNSVANLGEHLLIHHPIISNSTTLYYQPSKLWSKSLFNDQKDRDEGSGASEA
jgi:hypothetical protein